MRTPLLAPLGGPPPSAAAKMLRRLRLSRFWPWRYTFWHTRQGGALGDVLGRELICGQTCGCNRLTGCMADELGEVGAVHNLSYLTRFKERIRMRARLNLPLSRRGWR